MSTNKALKWTAALILALITVAAWIEVFFGGKSEMNFVSEEPQHHKENVMAEQTKQARILLKKAKFDSEKSYPLALIAKEDVNSGNLEEARAYAEELLRIAAKLKSQAKEGVDPDDGVAVHDGNMVLGRIAFKEHDTEEADKYLLKAGESRGSKLLDRFGPNMSLANDLLKVGERETVIRYFEECRLFWTDSIQLDRWTEEVRAGETPDFGANLLY